MTDASPTGRTVSLTFYLFYRSKIESSLEYSIDRLIHNTANLDDEMTVEQAGLLPESNIEALLDLEGGKRKRKKKVYTKPKKIKHKHKKRSMAVLDYYLVEDGGKVKCLKRESEFCEPGTYMADHPDRFVCGKTGVTHWKLTANGERLPIPAQNKPAVAVVAAAPTKAGAKGKKKK